VFRVAFRKTSHFLTVVLGFGYHWAFFLFSFSECTLGLHYVGGFARFFFFFYLCALQCGIHDA